MRKNHSPNSAVLTRGVHSKRDKNGFTLLEMLVVLALIAALVGLAAPSMGKMLDRFSEATTWRDVEASLNDLPYRTFATGRALVIDADNVRQFTPSLPADWKIVVVGAIRYRETGWCEGGRMTITNAEGVVREYALVAPRCEARAS
jgi:prepilin-type N-terminal cleavage/methylation domain-containing protein